MANKCLLRCTIIILTILLIPPTVVLTTIISAKLISLQGNTLIIEKSHEDTTIKPYAKGKIRNKREAIMYAVHAGILEEVNYTDDFFTNIEWVIKAKRLEKDPNSGEKGSFWRVTVWPNNRKAIGPSCTLVVSTENGFKPLSQNNYALTCLEKSQ